MFEVDQYERGYQDGYTRAQELHSPDDSMIEDMLGTLGDVLDEGANAFEPEEYQEGWKAGVRAYLDEISQ